jgi:hemin uptake protein HemP
MDNLTLFLLFVAVAGSTARRFGAPTSVCNTMQPNHSLNTPQTTPSPVRILLSKSFIKPNETITIRVEGINPTFTFLGFMIQTREVALAGRPMGTFHPGTNYYIMDCGDRASATHSFDDRITFREFTWTAPNFTGQVRVL